MRIQKSSGNAIILDSGSILAFSNTSDIEFAIVMDESFAFDLVLKFESDGKKQHNTKANVQNNKVEITCINYDNPLGIGTSKPIELGAFEGKKIYLNFWVFSLGNNTARKVSYTLYKEK